ncbi:4722_t:CDS:2, partial [Gigaspora rosea]
EGDEPSKLVHEEEEVLDAVKSYFEKQFQNDESAHATRLKKCKSCQINEGSDSDELQYTLRRQLRSKKRVLQSNWVKKEKE